MAEHYCDYFDIDPEYFPAVNEAVIEKNPDLWKKFFPHDSFRKMLKTTVEVLSGKHKQCIWVEGPYGTGKSHATLTLKKIIEASEEETEEYFEKNNLDRDVLNQLQCLKQAGTILTVRRSHASGITTDEDLAFAVQNSIEEALAAKGIENKAGSSLRESIIEYLSDEENKQSFNIYAHGSAKDLFGGDSAEDIVRKLQTETGPALQTLMHKLFRYGKNHPVYSLDTIKVAEWIKEVIKENNLESIVFLWDEFTEYFNNHKHNLTGLQHLCEICETDPFYFIIVTHVQQGIFSENNADFKKIEGRFVKPPCLITLPENIAFQLIGAALEKVQDATIREEWHEISDDLESRTIESRKNIKAKTEWKIIDSDLVNMLPIHPYAALMLKHISSAFDSNQRSMFDYLRKDEDEDVKNFHWFINHYGPYSENSLLTIDLLWDFFYGKNSNNLASDIRSILDYYDRCNNSMLDYDEKRVLKTVLLMQAISHHARDSVDLFIPNEKNLDCAFEGDMSGGQATRIAEKLVRDKILFIKSLGNGKKQYAAYITEINSDELEKYYAEVDRKTTTQLINESLVDKTKILDAFALKGALDLRFVSYYVSSTDFDAKLKEIINQPEKYENKLVAVFCFAKDDDESDLVNKKIRHVLPTLPENIIIIDASVTPFGQDGYKQYREEAAQALYQNGKDRTLSEQCSSNAKEQLRLWKLRLIDGQFVVYSLTKPDGDRAPKWEELLEILKEINKKQFPLCYESEYNLLYTMYQKTSPGVGVKCGIEQITTGVFKCNQSARIEDALKGAWGVENYWVVSPGLWISKLKTKVDKLISDAFNKSGRISIKEIYDALKVPPYGIMPCNFTALLLGFILKEYVNGKYNWTDEITNVPLTETKLVETINEVITLQTVPDRRYREKYIVALTEGEKIFNEATARIFDIPPVYCTSIEQTRDQFRNKLKEYSFPIWVIEQDLDNYPVKSDKKELSSIIENYCGVANNNNAAGNRSDNDLAIAIGKAFIDDSQLVDDLAQIFNKDNCTTSMIHYVESYKEGKLISLASEIGDQGQYINVLRSKFSVDAANWVWNKDTANQTIDEVILEYSIVAASNQINSKASTYNGAINEWITKCKYFRISYATAKNHFEELSPLMDILYTIKKTGTLPDSQRARFLELIEIHGERFKAVYNSQEDLFVRCCEYYLNGLEKEDVRAIMRELPSDCFTMDKPEYVSLVDQKVKEYKSNIKSEQLKALWKTKTNSDNPKDWSQKHKMPILCLVKDEEYAKARKAFSTILNRNAAETDIEDAINYLNVADFLEKINDESELDRAFRDKIIGNYDVLLSDLEEVKNYLISRVAVEPYDWCDNPMVSTKIQQLASAKYDQGGVNNALEKIEVMDSEHLREYLRELIKDNILVGMEIMKNN